MKMKNEKLNLSNMKLIIKELKVETVLVDFVNSWNENIDDEGYKLEIETIYDFANETCFIMKFSISKWIKKITVYF
jgi:hypothetical protein